MTTTSHCFSLHRFESAEHYAWYQELVSREPHRERDFYSSAELRKLIETREVDAWVAVGAFGLIGWCAVTLRSPHHPLAEAVHFLGAIVAEQYRGQGFGLAMVKERIALFPTHPITASVMPGNVPSERMLRTAGFRPGLMQHPWRTWHRPNHHHPMVLMENDDQVKALLDRGIYAELATKPVEGGNGRIARGLWPDEAAFHAIPAKPD